MGITSKQGQELLEAVAQAIVAIPGWTITDRGPRYVQAVPKAILDLLPPIGSSTNRSAWFALEFWINARREQLGAFWWANPVDDTNLRNRLIEALLDPAGATGLKYNGHGRWQTQRDGAFSGQPISNGWWPKGGEPDVGAAKESVTATLERWNGNIPAMVAVIRGVAVQKGIAPRLSARFQRGRTYTREEVQRTLGLEPASGGNWYTGYHEHDGEWFLFPNVGIPGRTGHNYGNRWEGTRLRWYGKTDTHLNQPAITRLLAPTAVVHLFTREADRSPFTYQGRVTAAEVHDVSPVEVVWQLPSAPWTSVEGELPGEEAESPLFREGSVNRVLVNAYERNPAARQACLDHWGTTCIVCGLNMEALYGPIASGFTHVHHLRSLAEIGAEYDVNPHEDLRPVCPNCHAVIHLRKPALTIEEIRELLRPPAQ